MTMINVQYKHIDGNQYKGQVTKVEASSYEVRCALNPEEIKRSPPDEGARRAVL